MAQEEILRYFVEYIFAYPFIMSIVWIFGAVYYVLSFEKNYPGPGSYPQLPFFPKVSILIPCHNEEVNIRETIQYLAETNYPDYEIVAINDGSKDNTGNILNELTTIYPQLRVVHLKQNRGKPTAQRVGALMANGDILVCMDGDALFEPNAVAWLVFTLLQRKRIGGVTGNPRIRNRTTLLGKIQVGEFSSIIGLIKRSQMNIARIFTVSGVICGFKKAALHEAGYWRTDMITDDIDITWRLMQNNWLVFYQPNAVCWILMPETLKGLWKQRLRWAQGGAEIIFKYGKTVVANPSLRMLPIFFDYLFSILWANILAIVIVFWILKQVGLIAYDFNLLIPTHWGLTLACVFIIQSSLSLLIDTKYEKGILKTIVWMIWYPLAYWMINAGTSFFGFYKAIFKPKKKFAVWTSPDRGIS
jgi:biofilm PGA synthesis N-glycosyltransferase PgaC